MEPNERERELGEYMATLTSPTACALMLCREREGLLARFEAVAKELQERADKLHGKFNSSEYDSGWAQAYEASADDIRAAIKAARKGDDHG